MKKKEVRSSHPFDPHTYSQERFSHVQFWTSQVPVFPPFPLQEKSQGLRVSNLASIVRCPNFLSSYLFSIDHSMDTFCSPYLYFSMLALLSDLLHYSQLLVWMPQHIFFKHCTKVCLHRLLQVKELCCAPSSARLTWHTAQGSTYWEGLPQSLQSLWRRADPTRVFLQKEGICASPKQSEPVASTDWEQGGKTATGHGDMLLEKSPPCWDEGAFNPSTASELGF